MNKEKVQAAMDDLKVKQDLFLISKLEEEYNELSDKCNKLYTFIYSLDFKEKVPDSNEQYLLQEQHKRMEAYRTNLYQRIEHYRIKVKIALGCDYFDSWGDVAEKIHQKHHCGQDAHDPFGELGTEGNPIPLPSPVDDGSAAVNEIPDSIKSLEGMQVIKVCGPKCKDCPCGDGLREYPSGRDMSSCVKVELVGDYMLCLAPLPNSIITE